MRLIVEFTASRAIEDLLSDIAHAGGRVPDGYKPVRMQGDPPLVCITIDCSPQGLESIRRIRGFVNYYGDAGVGPTNIR